MTQQIPLTNAGHVVVDDIDYDWLMEWKWHGNGLGYAVRSRRKGETTGPRSILMHRAIMAHITEDPLPAGLQVDHANGIKLDNRRVNLRLANARENTRNKRKPSSNTSGYKGVHFFRQTQRWQASIGLESGSLHLGYYDNALTAARIYDAAARRYFGEFAAPNFPNEPTSPEINSLLERTLNAAPSSPYIGVSWRADTQKWRAYLTKDGQLIHLGCFDEEDEAALARDLAAHELFGPEARLNFPEPHAFSQTTG